MVYCQSYASKKSLRDQSKWSRDQETVTSSCVTCKPHTLSQVQLAATCKFPTGSQSSRVSYDFLTTTPFDQLKRTLFLRLIIMQKPRHSILQLFDPLMAPSPQTPGREVTSTTPDSSDKENEFPTSSIDPLSLTQFFNRTYKVDRQPNPAAPRTPDGKLIDITINDDDQLVSISLDDRDLSQDDDKFSLEGEDSENAPPFIKHGIQETSPRVDDNPRIFMTPQNRKILADIDIDASYPPKPPVKQGTLKISFIRHAMEPKHEPVPSASEVAPSAAVSCSDELAVHAEVSDPNSSIPAIAFHPPTSEPRSSPDLVDTQASVNKSGSHLSPDASSYFGDSPPAPIPRRTLPSAGIDRNRISIDLQSSFQLQLQSSDFSFDLVNDRISFFGGQGSFIDDIEDYSDPDNDRKERSVEEVTQKACLGEAAFVDEMISGELPTASSVLSTPASKNEPIGTSFLADL
jgi:hypothetical protein